jgi:hypothetical protein
MRRSSRPPLLRSRSRSSFLPSHDAYGRLLHPLHPLRGWLFRAHGPGALLEPPHRERGYRRPSGCAPPGRAWAHADGLGDVRRRVSSRASSPLAQSRTSVLTLRRSRLSSLRAHSACVSDLHYILLYSHIIIFSLDLIESPFPIVVGGRPPYLGEEAPSGGSGSSAAVRYPASPHGRGEALPCQLAAGV